MIVCTSVCTNYIPKAMIMAKSLKCHDPSIKVVVCLVENFAHREIFKWPYFDDVVLAKDMGFPNFNSFIFKHSIIEASTAVKGQLFSHLLNKYKQENHFIYLDPDILVTGDFIELKNALCQHSIILTPHLLHEEETVNGILDNELCTLQHGIFNLGFLAIKRSLESKRFIDWWASRLALFCFDEIPRGIFTDQKWVDLAPCFFNVHILKHPGYNVAPWNLSKRHIEKSNGSYLVNGQPLQFIHFSGFDSGDCDKVIHHYVPNRNNAIYEIRSIYQLELNEVGKTGLGGIPWSYDYYYSSEKVSKHARIAYRNRVDLQKMYLDPFAYSNKIFET